MPAKKKPGAKAKPAPMPPIGGPYGGVPNAHGVNVVKPEPPKPTKGG